MVSWQARVKSLKCQVCVVVVLWQLANEGICLKCKVFVVVS